MRTTRPSRRLTRAMVVLAVAVTVASAAGACSPGIVDDAAFSSHSRNTRTAVPVGFQWLCPMAR